MKMKKKTKLICICAAAALLVLGAIYTVFIAPQLKKEKWVYIESQVERGTLKVGVTESGSLEYGITSILYDLDLSITSDDDDDDDDDEEEEETTQKYLKVEEVYVAAGQRVQEGDALIKFTEESVASVRKLLETAYADAKVDYNTAESEYDLAVLEAKLDYEKLKITEKYASKTNQYDKSNVTDTIASMQAEVSQRTANIPVLEEKLAEAQENYAEAKEEYEAACETMEITGTDNTVNFMIIQSGYLSAQTQYRNAQSALTQAQTNLDNNAKEIESLNKKISLAKAGQKLDVLGVAEEYSEAVIQGENAQITYDAALESLKEDLREEEENKKEIEDQLAAFEEFVGEDGIIRATEEGLVTEVGYESGDRLTQTGTVVAYATPADMTISVDVTQEDVVALSVGNTVEILFTAYPDVMYEGRILSIDTTATSRSSATISYQVVVGVEGDTSALYGGMTADITFVTEEKEDVLYVSRKAIVEQDGKSFVYVKTALGGRELTEVQTGIKNTTSVEILSGLSEDDVIYIASKVSNEKEITAQNENEASDSDSGSSGESDFSGMDGEMPDMSDFGGEMPDMSNFGGQRPNMGGAGGGMPGMGGGR